MNDKFADALIAVGPTPCEKYTCSNITMCANDVTDCKAFRYWVNNGSFTKVKKTIGEMIYDGIEYTFECFTTKTIESDVKRLVREIKDES